MPLTAHDNKTLSKSEALTPSYEAFNHLVTNPVPPLLEKSFLFCITSTQPKPPLLDYHNSCLPCLKILLSGSEIALRGEEHVLHVPDPEFYLQEQIASSFPLKGEPPQKPFHEF